VAKSNEELEAVEKQWDAFQETFEAPDALTNDELKTAVIEDLTVVSQMTVEEYTLYQKWLEIHIKYPLVEGLFGAELNEADRIYIDQVKENIWIPNDPMDYMNLQPRLIYTNGTELAEKWNTIRTFTSTMKNNNNIGRNLNYIVQDEVTGKYLGVICISSDFLDLTPRDKYIGWNRDVKTNQGMINHTAIGSTIVPLQPLGFNYLGGKLLALMCLTDKVQQDWKEQYGDTLVGVTTTSLYGQNKAGGLSQYDNLKHWKKMGYTSGSVSYETRKPTTALMLNWLKKNHTRKYFEWFIAKNLDGMPFKRDHKNRSNSFIYSQLGVDKELIKSEHARGIYFSPLYTNTNEYLRKEITEEALAKSFDTSYNALVGIWKEKYVARRVKSLIENDRFTKETLFYDDLVYMDWEETKAKYLPQVGR
jgi:Domain of unknown function (DUF4338)